jgi:CheY-like chemotaxis protein
MLLEIRGATTFEADGPLDGLPLADSFQPDLILYDADSDSSATGALTDELRQAASRNNTPIVILGKAKRFCGEVQTGQFVAKPYHYGPLIRKIDELLAAA